jgi:hypothetical protein
MGWNGGTVRAFHNLRARHETEYGSGARGPGSGWMERWDGSCVSGRAEYQPAPSTHLGPVVSYARELRRITGTGLPVSVKRFLTIAHTRP